MDALDLIVFVGRVAWELTVTGGCYLRLLWQANQARRWTDSMATIQAFVPEYGIVTTVVRVVYEYQVMGQYYGGTYNARVLNFSETTLALRFPPRSVALVRYDPNRPDHSLLLAYDRVGHPSREAPVVTSPTGQTA